MQFSGTILIRLSLIQDPETHGFTCGAPKSIHNLQLKAYKIFSVDEPTKEFRFCYV